MRNRLSDEYFAVSLTSMVGGDKGMVEVVIIVSSLQHPVSLD